MRYEVIVGNVGTVYSGTSKEQAQVTFDAYVDAARSDVGRASGESVTMFRNDVIAQEHPAGNEEV